MDEAQLRRFDWLVLKPAFIGLLVLALVYLVHAHWLAGTALVVLALLGVGAAGAALHAEKSFAELSTGYPSRSSAFESSPSSIDSETSLRIAKTAFVLGCVLAAAAVVVAMQSHLRWYFVLVIGVGVAWLGPAFLALPFATLSRLTKTRSDPAARPINAPGTVWDEGEAPDDELIASLTIDAYCALGAASP